ncbi:RNA-directed DNA polymerase, eukaryota, reverse transcriptase zinc-binding domain protein [Tanacetum coccineum]
MSQPKNLLKLLNSKLGDLATKFISIDGKHMMARRSVTDTQQSRVESVQLNMEQPSQHDMKSSSATVVSAEKESTSDASPERPPSKINFINLFNEEKVEDTDLVLPMDSILTMQRSTPIILHKWSPNLSFSKDEVKKVPVWVKMHKVPVVSYSEDGLSLIASQISTPIMLDAFTTSMCADPWGRIRHAPALIEVSADKELKQIVKMVVPVDMILNLKNLFETLSQQDDLVCASEAGECSGGNGDDRDRGDQLESLDTNSEVEEVYVEPMPKFSNSGNGLLMLVYVLRAVILYWDETPSPIERRQLWADLGCHKLVVRGMPWVLMGDYNVALNLEDSHSGSSRLNSAVIEFKDCVSQIEVMDINCSGIHFTWNQKPKGEGGLLKKLDRIMGNLKFVDSFPAAYALFQPYKISDHSPTVLKIPTLSGRKQKPFKFFNFLTSKVSEYSR